MENKPSRINFWEVAFTAHPQYIAIFILTLFAINLAGNWLFTILMDFSLFDSTRSAITIAVTIFLFLIAGFLWSERQRSYFPFSVSEENKLPRVQAVLAIPSNSGTIGKILRYHSGALRHIWLIGDVSVETQFQKCLQDYKDFEVSFHRVEVHKDTIPTTYDGYRVALREAQELGIADEQIVVDITGGKKPMSVQAFLMAFETGIMLSYVESNYEKIDGDDNIRRANEEFQVTRIDITREISASIFRDQSEKTIH